jgi:hypothetical protein
VVARSYPHSLHFLELLQRASFRKVLADQRAAEFIHAQQLYFWLNYRNTRLSALAAPAVAEAEV